MNFNWICLFVYLWDFCQQIIKKKASFFTQQQLQSETQRCREQRIDKREKEGVST